MTIHQFAQLDRHPHAAIIAAANRFGQKVMPGLFKPRQGANRFDPAFHVAVAGFPIVGFSAVFEQFRV